LGGSSTDIEGEKRREELMGDGLRCKTPDGPKTRSNGETWGER